MQLSLSVEDRAVAPPGLEFHAGFLTAQEWAELLGRIDGSEWLSDLMDFCCEGTGDEHVRRLESRSVVLLYGDARWKWRHGIAKRRTDTWNGQKVARDRRLSITFRTIAPSTPSDRRSLRNLRSAMRKRARSGI